METKPQPQQVNALGVPLSARCLLPCHLSKNFGLRGCQTSFLLGPGRDERGTTHSLRLKEKTRVELREQAQKTKGGSAAGQAPSRPEARAVSAFWLDSGQGEPLKTPSKALAEAPLRKELPAGFCVRCRGAYRKQKPSKLHSGPSKQYLRFPLSCSMEGIKIAAAAVQAWLMSLTLKCKENHRGKFFPCIYSPLKAEVLGRSCMDTCSLFSRGLGMRHAYQ